MKKDTVFAIVGLIIIVILQTTVLQYIAFKGVVPDIVLILLVFLSIYRGRMTGQVTGFSIGLIKDIIGLSPLGFNSLILTIIGHVGGIFHKKVFLDPVVLPLVMVGISTIVKYILSIFCISIFSLPGPEHYFLNSSFWIELVYNVVLAPFMFLLFRMTSFFSNQRSDGFSV